MTANPDPIVSGGLVLYEFKLTNIGGTTLTDVVLTDVTDNAANAYVSRMTGGATCSGSSYCVPGQTVTWPAFTLAPGQTQTVWLTNTIIDNTANGTVVRNTATVTYGGQTVTQSCDVRVDASIPLRLGLTADRSPVGPGEQLTYQVTMGNSGTQSLPLSNVGVVTATVPEGTSFVAASAGGAHSNGTITWSVGSLDPGKTEHFTFTVVVGAGVGNGTVLKPTAELRDGMSSLARGTSLTEVRASVPLRLTLVANPDPAAVGDLVFYEYKVSNVGSTPLTNVVLSEVTQDGAHAYVSQMTGGATCSGSSYCSPGQIVSWPAFALAAGQTQTVWLTNTIAAGTANGSLVRSEARLAYAGGMVVTTHDLAIDSAASLRLGLTPNRNPASPGDPVTYTLSAGNRGTQSLPLSNAGVLTATVPAGTSFVSASGGGTHSNGTIQWNVDSIEPGETEHYTFTVNLASSVAPGTVLKPTAEVRDGTTSLVRATSLTEVRASVPLRLTLVANPDPAVVGDLVSYEYQVSNVGSTRLTNVVLTGVTQNGAHAYVSQMTGGASCSGASYCVPGQIVSWPAFTLAPGQTETVWLTNTIASGTAHGSLVRSEARLSYTGGMVQAAHDLSIDSAAKLRLGVVPSRNPAAPGSQLTYSIVVGNRGTQALPLSLAGVLTARLPEHTSFVAASNGGTNTNGVVQWGIGWVDPGSVQRREFTVSVDGGAKNGMLLESLAQLWDGETSAARALTSTEVRAAPPLTLEVSVSPDPVAPNGFATYTYVVTNVGATPLANVLLTSVTQNQALAYISQMTGGGACGGSSYCSPGVIASWPAFTLASGQSATVTRKDTIPAGTVNGTVIRSQARVTYASGSIVRSTDIATHD